LAALPVALLLILTALGSAWLMFAVALLGVAGGLLVLRGSPARSRSILTAVLAALLAAVIAMLLWWL
jgi:hypothetical protein